MIAYAKVNAGDGRAPGLEAIAASGARRARAASARGIQAGDRARAAPGRPPRHADPSAIPALRLGAALASLHALAPAPPTALHRLEPDRLATAVAVIARARPDGGAAAGACSRAADRPPRRRGPPVCLHGDANLRNALLDGDRVGLVDLEDAAAGPAAADLGQVLAGLLPRGRATAAPRALRRLRDRSRPAARRGRAALAHGRVGAGPHRAAGRRAACGPTCCAACGPCCRPRRRSRRGMRPALLFYCQHSVGLGHLMRSYALCAALADRFRVVLVCGGPLPDGIEPPRGVELVALPPLGVGPGGRFVSHDRRFTVERGLDRAARAHPRRAARAPAGGRPRRAVPVRAREVRARDRAAARGGARDGALTACSLRDILVRARSTSGATTSARASSSTPTSTRSSSTATLASRASRRRSRPASRCRAGPLHGLRRRAAPGPRPAAAHVVVVSAGGGRVGEPLLRAAAEAAARGRRADAR